MARYTGPKARINRKFNEPILGETKALLKKNYPPGIGSLNFLLILALGPVYLAIFYC